MKHVLVCTVEPSDGVCPAENQRFETIQLEPDQFQILTISEFKDSLPWVIAMLCIAWSAKQTVRFLLNR